MDNENGATGDAGNPATNSQSEVEELKRKLDAIQKAQAGSDRTVAELRKQLEEKEAESKRALQTAEERNAERIAKLEAENEAAKRAAERERFLATGYRAAQERALPSELVDKFNGTADELVTYLDSMKKWSEDQVVAEVTRRLQGAASPKVGSAKTGKIDVTKMTYDQILELESKGELNDLL